jgi:hypothetical protein
MICRMTKERPTDIQTSAPLIAWGVFLVGLGLLGALFVPLLGLPMWLAWLVAVAALAGLVVGAFGVLYLAQHADRSAGVLRTVRGTF